MAKKVKKLKPEQCKLGELIREHIAAKKAVETLPKKPALPAPKNSYTVAEWNQYQTESKDYALKLEKYNEAVKAIKDRLETSRKAIVENLPRTLTWFVTEDKHFAVALQTSDWPGDKARVIYRSNPVLDQLPVLRMQIIN
jgi:hypothetical protein